MGTFIEAQLCFSLFFKGRKNFSDFFSVLGFLAFTVFGDADCIWDFSDSFSSKNTLLFCSEKMGGIGGIDCGMNSGRGGFTVFGASLGAFWRLLLL